jgi:hypothetical protein
MCIWSAWALQRLIKTLCSSKAAAICSSTILKVSCTLVTGNDSFSKTDASNASWLAANGGLNKLLPFLDNIQYADSCLSVIYNAILKSKRKYLDALSIYAC